MFAPTADDTVRGTMIASGAKRYTASAYDACAGAASPFTLARSCLGRLPTTLLSCCTSRTSDTWVMIVRSTAGITTKNRPAITASGTQKSRA